MLTLAAVILGTVVLSATPAQARPVQDSPTYYGPGNNPFAGRTVSTCVLRPTVYHLPGEYRCSR
jgi:hypothetical protein